MTVTALNRWPREEASSFSRAVEGSEEAFAEIVREHEAMVYSICLNALHDRGRAEEIAQEVFLQLYRNLDRLESPKHLTNWLRRTATHRVIDAARAHTPVVSLELIREPETDEGPGDPLLRERLETLVAELPVMQRMAVILRYGEEMQLSEIAETLEAPINTVKSNLRRGLARLRERLSMEGEVR